MDIKYEINKRKVLDGIGMEVAKNSSHVVRISRYHTRNNRKMDKSNGARFNGRGRSS